MLAESKGTSQVNRAVVSFCKYVVSVFHFIKQANQNQQRSRKLYISQLANKF